MKILLALLLFTGSISAQVTSDRILNANREPQNWLTYSGGYFNQYVAVAAKGGALCIRPALIERTLRYGAALPDVPF